MRFPYLKAVIYLMMFAAGLLAGCAASQAGTPTGGIEEITVVMDNNYPPYSFLDETGQPQGITIDHWRLWEEKTGIRVNLVPLPWGEALTRFLDGEFDVIDTIFYTDERARVLSFTEPYADIDVGIFFRNNISGINSAEHLTSFRVGVKSGDANVEYLLERGVDKLVYYESYEQIIQSAADNEINVFVIDLPPGLYYLYQYDLQPEFNVSQPLYGGQFHRAVRQGDESLLALVRDGFARISALEYQQVQQRWFGIATIPGGLDSLQPYLLPGVLTVVAILGGLIFFNRVLQDRVSVRTQALESTLSVLRERDERLRVVTENAPDAIMQVDRSGKILFINRVVPGLTPEEVLGTNIRAWTPEHQHKMLFNALQKAFETGERQEYESMGPGPHGAINVYSVRVMPVTLEGHSDTAIYIATDITERHTMTEQLRQSEEKYRRLVETINTAIFISTMDGRMLEVNSATVEMFGYASREDFLHISALSLYENPGEREYIKSQLLEKGYIRNYELLERRANGEPIWTSFSAVLLNEYNGEKNVILGTVIDITKLKATEEDLRNSEQRLRILFEKAGVGVAHMDSLTGRFLQINQKYCDLIGYTQEELQAIDFQTLTHPEDLEKDLKLMEQLKGGEIREFTIEKRYIRKDGSIVWALLIVSPLWQPGEPPSTHIGIIHDITEWKRTEFALQYSEAQLRKFNLELEHRVVERTSQLQVANQELEAFAYSVSHDLRAPLRAIDGFARILIEEHGNHLDEQARALIDRMRNANQNMSQLVDALLGLSRTARAEIHKEKINLSLIAQDIRDDITSAQPDPAVEWNIEKNITVIGDARLLRIVLENLLGNAWKFSSRQPNPRIDFGTRNIEGQQVYFVSDNGVGFNMDYASKLFGAFQRLHSSQEFEGTGIGLATVQRIIQRHGGRIWGEAAINQGATFYFTLGETT